MSTLPELFATWSVERSRQFSSGTTGTIMDNAATMTITTIPITFVTVPIKNSQHYGMDFNFLVLTPVSYVIFIYWNPEESGLALCQMIAFNLSFLGVLRVKTIGIF